MICEFDKDLMYLRESLGSGAGLTSTIQLGNDDSSKCQYEFSGSSDDLLSQLALAAADRTPSDPLSSAASASANHASPSPSLEPPKRKYSHLELEVFEKHLSVLSFFTFTGYTTWKEKYGLMALHPMMLAQDNPNLVPPRKISDHLRTSMLSRAVFLSNHEFITKSGFANKGELADSLYPFVPVDVMSLDQDMDLFEVCDLIKSLFLRMIQCR